MIEHVEGLVRRYARKGVLVDTNLLLLWLIGSVDTKRISQFGPTRKYSSPDFEVLLAFLGHFDKRVTTPNVLTEVSNLARKDLHGNVLLGFSETFSRAVGVLDETYIASSAVSSPEAFAKFGLTDCGIAAVAARELLVLTDDFALSQSVVAAGGDAVNFNHLRDWLWD